MTDTLRNIFAICVLIYFIVVLGLLKRRALSLKYTLLWLLAGVCMGVLVIFPDLLRKLSNLIGIYSEVNGLFLFAIFFVICILMSITAIISRQNVRIRKLTQALALMEKQLRDKRN